jgi:hypothetical protein
MQMHTRPTVPVIARVQTPDGRWILRANGRVSFRATGDSAYRMAGQINGLPRGVRASSALQALQVHITARTT